MSGLAHCIELLRLFYQPKLLLFRLVRNKRQKGLLIARPLKSEDYRELAQRVFANANEKPENNRTGQYSFREAIGTLDAILGTDKVMLQLAKGHKPQTVTENYQAHKNQAMVSASNWERKFPTLIAPRLQRIYNFAKLKKLGESLARNIRVQADNN